MRYAILFRSDVLDLKRAPVLQVCCLVMEGFTFFLRVGSRVIGRISAHLDTSDTLAGAKGRLAALSVCLLMKYRRF